MIVLLAVYAGARLLQVNPHGMPMVAVVAFHVVPPAAFAWIHGALQYRVRGIALFFALCLMVGGTMENFGVLTGFPYGHYHFTDVMGPKVFLVPALLGLAYVGVGYWSWIVAVLITGAGGSGARVVTVPIVGTFVMVAWDVAMDPVWSTIVKAWIWHDGGPYFGVPLSNFAGWVLTVYLIFQLFALTLPNSAGFHEQVRHWRLAVAGYAIAAAGNVLLLIPNGRPPMVVDATGQTWSVAAMTASAALMSIFAMGAFAVVAWVREQSADASEPRA